MNKKLFTVVAFGCLLFTVACSQRDDFYPDGGKYVYHGAGNPYLPLWEHLPDGEPRVFEDPDFPGKYRVYIIGSHDVRYDSYCGPDIRMWSAPVEDLSSWRDEGAIFTYQVGDLWDVMYAPDLVEVNHPDGLREYYLFPHSRGPRREAMVAKGSRPDGPFTPVNLNDEGTAVLPGSILGFDPSVFVDPITDPNDSDFEIGYRVYGFWGYCRSSAAQLDPTTMYSVRPGTECIPYFMPASRIGGVPADPEGTVYPCIYPGEDHTAFCFYEASSLRKVGNKYVSIYSGHSGPEYGLPFSNATLRYAYSDSPLGPWHSGGVLIDARGPVQGPDSTIHVSYAGHNTHGSIERIGSQWYVFYHRAPRGFGYARQAMVAPICVEYDEASVADGGQVRICAFDPYSVDGRAVAPRDAEGREYRGAEVTSEGFHVFGLNPYDYYSAGIACYLSNPNLQSDNWDVWDNSAPVSGLRNGDVVGYKYFGFGGLAVDTLGLKAFPAASSFENTFMDLFVSARTTEPFKILAFLDAPSVAEGGTPLGVFACGPAPVGESCLSIIVTDVVKNLTGKHAVYLVSEGPEGEVLCDLIGLGFREMGKELNRPEVPVVVISADDKPVEIPLIPVRSTEENGLVDASTYRLTYIVPSGQTSIPSVKAEAADKEVEISVQQAVNICDGAVVKACYRGLLKTYIIDFVTCEQ